jgi:hypothetical protein
VPRSNFLKFRKWKRRLSLPFYSRKTHT